MKMIETRLPGVLILEPRVFRDDRGHFAETWHRERYRDAGIAMDFVQDNVSYSRHGVLRGLHFQNPAPQGKLVSVLQGEVFDVAVDLRRGSRTFGQWVGVELSGDNMLQLWIPEGFAHGFVVTGESALFSYKCTRFYAPEHEKSLRWDDPEIGIDWPIESPIVSPKDARAAGLGDIPRDHLFD